MSSFQTCGRKTVEPLNIPTHGKGRKNKEKKAIQEPEWRVKSQTGALQRFMRTIGVWRLHSLFLTLIASLGERKYRKWRSARHLLAAAGHHIYQ